MVRTQLYLPDGDYQYVKTRAEAKKLSFAAYVRVLIEKDRLESKKNKTLKEQFPFIGMIKGIKGPSDAKEIDKIVYGL